MREREREKEREREREREGGREGERELTHTYTRAHTHTDTPLLQRAIRRNERAGVQTSRQVGAGGWWRERVLP